MNWKVLSALVISYFLYLLIGAAIFQAIERPNEVETCDEIRENVTLFRQALEDASENLTLANITYLILSLQEAASKYKVQITKDFNVTCAINWDFQSSFFFSGTVVTTIGYGNIAPATQLGRSICILYAIIGLPLFGLMFSGIGDKIAGAVKKLDTRIRGRAKRTWVGKIVLIGIVTVTFLTFFMLVPAAIFEAVEQWSYHEAFYYSFITLTTIGFGDLVIGTDPEIDYIAIYRVLVYFWIVFGIAFMATLISLVGEFWKKTGKSAKRKKVEATSNQEEVDGENEQEEVQDGEKAYELQYSNAAGGEEAPTSSTESLEKKPFTTHYENVENGKEITEPTEQNNATLN